MRRALALSLSLVALLGTTGCGGDDDESDSPAGTAPGAVTTNSATETDNAGTVDDGTTTEDGGGTTEDED